MKSKPEAHRIKTLSRIFVRLAVGAGMTALVLFTGAVLYLRYVALPDVESMRPRIIASLESASGMKVSMARIDGGWGGLRPRLSMQDFGLADHRGATVLRMQHAEATLSWWALLLGEVRFHHVELDGPQLVLRRGKDGLIYLADKPLNAAGPGDGEFARWLLAQPSLRITDATLVWQDEKVSAPEVRLSGVEILIRRRGGRHHAALIAKPPAHLAARLELRANLALKHEDQRWSVVGSLYAEALQADLARLRTHLPLPESLRSGSGSVRLWAEIDPEGMREVTADLAMRDARAQLAADLLPLELASVSGRATYAKQAGGFSFATKDLRIRTRGGAESKPATFAVTLAKDERGPRGEVTADAIDLKLAATLLDYFPVPRDVKGHVLQYAPRGHISKATLAWRGESLAKASTLSVSGNFEDLAVNAVNGYPAVQGLTGSVSGDEKGGTLKLASKKASLEIAEKFPVPFTFDRLETTTRWKVVPAGIEVAIEEARFANADVEGEVSGTWRSLPAGQEGSKPGHAELKGTLSRFEPSRVVDYLPSRYEHTRGWLARAVSGGTGTRARFEVRGDLWHFPFVEGKDGRFWVEGDIHGVKLKYHPDWPSIDAIDAHLVFEGAQLDIRSDGATIFSSRVKEAKATIANLLAQPPILEISGQIVTGGTDSVKFLRESPLINGPGAFTRAVQIDGPARLGIAMRWPLYGTESARITGDYLFDGANARVGQTLSFNGVKGKLQFTEKGVRAPELTGTMFGQPARLKINTQGDGTLLTELDGRIAMPVLGAYIPDAISARLTGGIDWRAALVSGRGGSDLRIESDLKGLEVALPAPFDKAEAVARPLTIAIRQLGSDNEVTTASLDGGIYGRFGTRRTPEGDRWHGALKFGAPLADEPIKDGVWLYGELAHLDLDAWQAVFPARARAVADARIATGTELRGFDLKLDRVQFTQREFPNVSARLERVGTEWKGRLEGQNLAGDVAWSSEGKGRVVARLSRLALRPQGPQPAREARPPRDGEQRGAGDLPALDIVAERFDFKGNSLGRLDLKAEPTGDEWRIERLDILNPHTTFKSKGVWRQTATGSITTLDLALDTSNLNALFEQFGFGDYVRGGTAKLQGTLAWPGFPNEFDPSVLQGSFKLSAARGQFNKIQAGAGKLLGLLSLQSLPQRVTLDFRDVFSEGFAFNSINANVKVARGILLTDDLEISGPAAFVSMVGEVSLPRETQSLTLRVVPEIGESVALAATVLGTPVLGLSTLLVSKLLQNPLGKVVAYEYLVTGTWDNPSVTPVSVPPPRATKATAEAAQPAKIPPQ
ncbi:YhdP family protein [Usitatibacter palustris]|uniref:YhdP central domain-containing protein n=1 Tax=Usitatibacter palustris TaxID=2732487 RepID=A0A6M4HB87_9PROT|nr:YhdP family protein [Usitatibacter palustris]QJR15734.1 hypothetical protein DSM104440_02560 [Usitatibacter palustris]